MAKDLIDVINQGMLNSLAHIANQKQIKVTDYEALSKALQTHAIEAYDDIRTTLREIANTPAVETIGREYINATCVEATIKALKDCGLLAASASTENARLTH